MEMQLREKALWGTGRVVKGGESKCKIIQTLPCCIKVNTKLPTSQTLKFNMEIGRSV